MIAALLAASLVSLVLFVSFGSALSLVWRCPIFLQFTISVSLCFVCSRARLVLGCIGSGQAKDKKFSGKRVLRYPLVCCKVCLPIQSRMRRSVLTALHISDLRVLQLAWNTWRSRRVCKCPHHLAVRLRRGVPLLCLQWRSWCASPLVVVQCVFWDFGSLVWVVVDVRHGDFR